jgi:predicted permease
MTTPQPTPPAVAERLLRAVCRPEDYPHVAGDLREEFAEWAVPTLGRRSAQWWYYRQVLLCARPGVALRILGREDLRAITRGVGGDVRHAVRSLRTSPATTAVLLATLALGIGANTAMFTVANALLLRPFPFADPDRLVRVHARMGDDQSRLSVREVADLNERAQSFVGFAGYRDSAYNFNGHGGPAEHFVITRVTHHIFDVLGVQPVLGRPWSPLADRTRSFEVALTHDVWVRRFNADPTIIGQHVMMDGYPNTVAAVLPPDFTFPARAALLRTWGINRDPSSYGQRTRRDALVVARIKPGVAFVQAQAELHGIARQLARDFPSTNTGVQLTVEPLRDMYVGHVRPYLLLLSGAVSLVLLMACVNVTNLLLTRATGRHREMAVRAALGASRWRLVRQALVESLVLSAFGGLLGVAFALWALRVLSTMIRGELPPWMDIRVDGVVLVFVTLVSVATALGAGLLPAVAGVRHRLAEQLKEGARGSGGRSRVRNGLVVSQVGLAVVLLVGAGLMVQSFQRLQAVDLGFRPERLVTFHVGLSWNKYDLGRATSFQTRVLEGLRTLPEVEGAFLNTNLPLTGRTSMVPISLPGQASESDRIQNPLVSFQQVSAGYHRGLGIRLLRGRLFEHTDDERAARVAVVSESLATQLWRGRDPIGQQLQPDINAPWRRDWVTVIGVVGDVKHDAPSGTGGLDLYVPYTQAGSQVADFVVRTSGDPNRLLRAVEQVVARVDPEEPVSDVATMDQVVADTVWQRTLATRLFTLFGALALVLACGGLYGVIAYGVSRRMREIGIRGALGARREDVIRMVLADGLRVALPGVALGLIAAAFVGPVLRGVLFEVGPADLVTLAGAPLILLAAAMVACYLPARRAARVDPLTALREE